MIIIFLCCLFGVSIIGFLCVNHLYKKTNDYKNSCIDIKNYKKGIPVNLQMVNLGSTYSKFAFASLDEMEMNTCDLSLQSQSLEMDKAILHSYINHIAPGGVVVVVLAACLLLYKEKGDNLLYYQILKNRDNPCFTLTGKIKSIFPLLTNPRKIKKIIIDVDIYQNIYDSFPAHLPLEKSKDALINLIETWKKLFGLKDLKSVKLSDENWKTLKQNQNYLGEILDLCKQKKLNPVIVIPPFSEKLNYYFSPEFKEKVINETIEKVLANRNIPFLNYQDDIEFQNSPELFVDGGFRLNKHGSKIFVRRFSDDLKKYGIYISNKTMGKRKTYVTENYEKNTI